MARDRALEVGLGPDRDPFRIQLAGELGRVDAPVDVGNLCRGEADDVERFSAAVDEVEVVEVAAGGARDEHSRPVHE